MAFVPGASIQRTQTQNSVGADSEAVKRNLFQMALKKGQVGTAADIYTKDFSGELGAQQKKDILAKDAAERLVTNFENFYFGKKLSKGLTPEGLQTFVTGQFDPRNDFNIYKSNLRAVTARLAKAYGDTGNIAYQEQLQQIKAFPTVLDDRTSAMKRWTLIRQNLGIKPRTRY